VAQVVVCSQINTKLINTMWEESTIFQCWCITWPVGFKRLKATCFNSTESSPSLLANRSNVSTIIVHSGIPKAYNKLYSQYKSTHYNKNYQQMRLFVLCLYFLFLVFSLHVSGFHEPIIRGISSCCFYATIWFLCWTRSNNTILIVTI